MTLDDWRNIATIAGVLVALVVYVTNSVQYRKQRTIDNSLRFITVHQRLFQNPFLDHNWLAIEKGGFKRDRANKQMEAEFAQLLGEIEYLAILQKAGVLSRTMNIYMFGWWAQRLQPLLTPDERNNVYWELAVGYLDEMKSAADDFYKLSKQERTRDRKSV